MKEGLLTLVVTLTVSIILLIVVVLVNHSSLGPAQNGTQWEADGPMPPPIPPPRPNNGG